MVDEPRYPQSSRKFARAQCRNMTRAEIMLWEALRDRWLDGHGFRKQTPIGPYFADFVCLQRKLIVEADGRTHESVNAKVRDGDRDAWLHRAGLRVLRFPDDLIVGGLPIVIERIRAALGEPKRNPVSRTGKAARPLSPSCFGAVSTNARPGRIVPFMQVAAPKAF